MPLLITNLTANIEDKEVIRKLFVEANDGDVLYLLGQNGAGKSSLLKAIAGHFSISNCSGEVFFGSEGDLLLMEPSERARRGVFMAYQTPIEIEGVKTSRYLSKAVETVTGEKVKMVRLLRKAKELCQTLGLPEDVLNRDLNVGLSGGEKKKMEILQMLLLKPSLILLDEIDSGVDVDSMKVIGRVLRDYREKNPECIILIVSHYYQMLDELAPSKTIVLKAGEIIELGTEELARNVLNGGF